MSPTARSCLSLGALCLLLAACGDGVLDIAVPDEELSDVEVSAVADEVAALAYGSVATEVPGSPGAAAVGAPGTVRVDGRSFSTALPCQLGGDVHLSGTAAGELDLRRMTASVVVTATKVHRDCAFDAGDAVLTLNGDPELVVVSSLSKVAGEPFGFQSLELAGAVRWGADDGRSGRCEVQLSVLLDPGPRTRTTTGTLCGQDVSVVESWSLDD